MIKISAKRLQNKYCIKIKGHSGFVKGRDIICAAVSILYFSLLSKLENDDGVYFLKSREADGFGEIRFSGGNNTPGAFEMAVEGFKLLRDNFPKNIDFTYERKEENYEK